MKTYLPSTLAKRYGLHPNTIRLYERLGYLSPAERTTGNYRIFTEMHLWQIEICRCVFGYPFTNRKIRAAGNEVLKASAKQQWETGREYTERYLQIIQEEIDLAQGAIFALNQWVHASNDQIKMENSKYVSRRVIADHFGITVETVRNWERNRLITAIDKGEKGESLYAAEDLNKISVIYMLIQTGFSIAAVQRSLALSEKGQAKEIALALSHPKREELVSVGDRWLYELLRLRQAAKALPGIFDKLITLTNK